MTSYLQKFNKKINKPHIIHIIWAIFIAFNLVIFSYITLVTSFYNLAHHFTPEQEEKIWHMMKASFGFDENYELDETYNKDLENLQKLVNNLPNNIKPDSYPNIEILIMNNDFVNAFAAPGGKIILTTGLLEALTTENAVMYVIGHELGHFNNKDHLHECARVLSASIFSSIAAKNSYSLLSDILMIIDSKSSRIREFYADRWGIKTIQTIYGHSGGAREFFDILLEQEGKNDNDILAIINSHPPTSLRIEAIEYTIKTKNLPLYPGKPLLSKNIDF